MTGRPQGFDEQVLAHRSALRGFALKLSRDPSRADDMVQDTIVRALVKFEQYEPGTNLRAWLFTIMKNDWFSAGRKRGREVQDTDGVFAGQVSVGGSQEWAYDLKVVMRRMRMLNSVQRRCIELVEMEEYPYQEAADILGIPKGTVKSAVSRAHAILETGDVDNTERVVEEHTAVRPGSADRIEQLYLRGLSIAEIKLEVGGVTRSDIMSVIVERKLKAPAR